MNKLFTVLGGKFKFSGQDSDLEYLCWRCKSSPVSFDLKPPLAFLFKISSFLICTQIECTVDVVLPKEPKNQFQTVWQNWQQALRAYCPKTYTWNPSLVRIYLVRSPKFICYVN